MGAHHSDRAAGNTPRSCDIFWERRVMQIACASRSVERRVAVMSAQISRRAAEIGQRRIAPLRLRDSTRATIEAPQRHPIVAI